MAIARGWSHVANALVVTCVARLAAVQSVVKISGQSTACESAPPPSMCEAWVGDAMQRDLVRVAKKLKKNNVAVDIVKCAAPLPASYRPPCQRTRAGARRMHHTMDSIWQLAALVGRRGLLLGVAACM